jgi:hypothetical protein
MATSALSRYSAFLSTCTTAQYCGSSLSRVGLDFQALLLPLFEACGLQLFAAHLSNAVDGFNLRLEAHKWVAMPAPVLSRGRADKQAQQQAALALAQSASASGEGG